MSKTHVIGGKKYVEVARRAEIGEKIVITKHPHEPAYNGNIYKVTSITGKVKVGAEGVIAITSHDEFYHGEYRVLVEVDVESPDITDLLANLARRVASLEQQLRDTQGNVEKLAEELATVKHTQKFYNNKTSAAEFTIDMILHDLTIICEKIKKHGGNYGE
jgi:hypothetical protein